MRINHGVFLAAGDMADHVHLLMGLSLPDKYSSLIRDLKTNSSIWINQHHPCGWRFAW
jgi:putative transposase